MLSYNTPEIDNIVKMGFSYHKAKQALLAANGNVVHAVDFLLSEGFSEQVVKEPKPSKNVKNSVQEPVVSGVVLYKNNSNSRNKKQPKLVK